MGQQRWRPHRKVELHPQLPGGLNEILDDLNMFQDRSDRIEALIDFGKRYQHKDADAVPRLESRRVPGCESEVFLHTNLDSGGQIQFAFAVDNPQGISAMALTVILQEGLTNLAPSDFAELPESLVQEIFGKELSMGKNLGLTNMIRMLKGDARKLALAAQ